MGRLELLVLGTFCQAFGLVGNEHRDVYDHKYYADGKKSWEELESWSNAKAFTHYWNANVISEFLVPALK